jgi:methyltransferase NSUN6
VAMKLKDLERAAHYQRLMLREAVHVLAVGGVLVYSTCTLNPQENEGNVRWALERYPQLELAAQSPRLGGDGLSRGALVPCADGRWREEQWLDPVDAAKVQRFDTTVGVDAIAFFIAKFTKVAAIPEDDAMEAVPETIRTHV